MSIIASSAPLPRLPRRCCPGRSRVEAFRRHSHFRWRRKASTCCRVFSTSPIRTSASWRARLGWTSLGLRSRHCSRRCATGFRRGLRSRTSPCASSTSTPKLVTPPFCRRRTTSTLRRRRLSVEVVRLLQNGGVTNFGVLVDDAHGEVRLRKPRLNPVAHRREQCLERRPKLVQPRRARHDADVLIGLVENTLQQVEAFRLHLK